MSKKLDILFRTILEEPITNSGFNTITFINTAFETRNYQPENEFEEIQKIFEPDFFQYQNDLLLKTQLKALSIVYFRGYNEKLIFDKIKLYTFEKELIEFCIFILERLNLFKEDLYEVLLNISINLIENNKKNLDIINRIFLNLELELIITKFSKILDKLIEKDHIGTVYLLYFNTFDS